VWVATLFPSFIHPLLSSFLTDTSFCELKGQPLCGHQLLLDIIFSATWHQDS